MQCLEDIITLTLLILQVLLEHRSNIDVLTWAMSMSACLLGMATDMFFCWNTQFSSVQSLSRVRLFVTPWMAACQASLSITDSRSLLKLMPFKLVMPSSQLILCSPLILLPPVPPSIRVFSNESTLCMRWPKYWSFSFSISPSNEHPGLISLQSRGLSRVFSNTTV